MHNRVWTTVMLIIMDGEHNHSMGSLMDGTPPQSETNSDCLMKDKSNLWGSPVHWTPHAVITLTIHYDQQLHTAIIQHFLNCYVVIVSRISASMYCTHAHTRAHAHTYTHTCTHARARAHRHACIIVLREPLFTIT